MVSIETPVTGKVIFIIYNTISISGCETFKSRVRLGGVQPLDICRMEPGALISVYHYGAIMELSVRFTMITLIASKFSNHY
jgi:hypothetical protein